jgi:hypothetical protein
MAKKSVLTPSQWENLSDEELLQLRVCDLGLAIPGTVLDERLARLHAELDERGIQFHPPAYLADEWLCPDKVPIIGIPFFLAHPRLTHLERKMMLEAEGRTDAWCMKLLRHECGHALNYAYLLYRRTRWRELFGPFSARYSSSYTTQPYSRRFVNHLEDNYAQAHPDEDFAETFAVWLAPHSRWRETYKGWPVLRKLAYVERVMGQIAGRPPLNTDHQTPWAAARMRSTLAVYYERKRRALGDDFPGYYDPALRRLFPPSSSSPAEDDTSAAAFLRRNRRRIVDSVAAWTHHRKYDIDKLVRKLILRCRELGGHVQHSELDTAVQVTALVAAIMSNVGRIDEEPHTR